MAELGIAKIIENIKNFSEEFNKPVDSDNPSFPLVKEEEANYALFNILNKLRRNSLIFEKYSTTINRDIFCKYLNNWLNEKRYSFTLSSDDQRDQMFYDKINQYYTRTSDIKHGINGPCTINQVSYSSAESSILNKLENLCYIRKQLKGINKLQSIKDECLLFYNYMYSTMNSILEIILLKSDKKNINLDNLVKNCSCGISRINDIFTELRCEYENHATGPLNRCTGKEHCRMEVGEDSGDNCNCTYSDIFLSIFFTLIGTLFLSFVLYRFSPFGSSLRSYLIRKKGIRNITEVETPELLLQTDEDTIEQYQNDSLNVTYSSF
ncbi:PIR Superfamily Protein [Plasmodium ovale wallikeri]|uniref:PIR Superfamily Protein n=1 Tax=Plasmodium ovale wallikeri TaxID=864142 RepID=A0A1A9APC7_PLAOA|nr:PIR Superfamily Protein [Plasmodium ovale wallikeri]SBT59523.1 PIR Superfamily Protein [Plasmodium ovale wallikeri]